MIIYSATKSSFTEDVLGNQIDTKILEALRRNLNRTVSPNEIESWKNSLLYMNNVVMDDSIPSDAGVNIEYNVPQTSKRIDFILTGKNAEQRDNAIIVELKQWSEVKTTTKDAIVRTVVNRAERELEHPSYQAWCYASLLNDYNETIQNEDITLAPCAYLHNCVSETEVRDERYREHLDKAPVFLRSEMDHLRAFIKQRVVHGDRDSIMRRIETGRIRPSKNLADVLLSMLQGNKEFLMIDDQKLVFETALEMAAKATSGKKQVLIVEGGPGTGKSVVAINLLVQLTSKQFVAQYVTKNAAPRAVYESKLTGTFKKTHIGNLFKGSGAYCDSESNSVDALIVDEAHRLNEKSGMYSNLGDNQIKEIIHTAKFSVFFIDEDQRVTWKDIGEKAEIRRWAERAGAEVCELELASQFRCNGSDGYLSWLDNSLQISQTANSTLDGIDYDLQVFDSPSDLKEAIVSKNLERNSARVVAGYCWDWASKRNPGAMDICFEEHGFEAQWNLTDDGSLWIAKPNSVEQVGCIHTCQGLELDYVGVIIGPDLVVRDGVVITDPTMRSKNDSSIKGYKKLHKQNPSQANRRAEMIIKNTYRTLMSRAQKGCYIYCTDEETSRYFEDVARRIGGSGSADGDYEYALGEAFQNEYDKVAEAGQD